jgi:hypothetical protein
MRGDQLFALLRDVALHHQHNGACGTDGYNPPFDGDHCLRCRIDAAIAEGRRVVVAIEPSKPPRPMWPAGVSCPKCLTLLAQDGACERCNMLFTVNR